MGGADDTGAEKPPGRMVPTDLPDGEGQERVWMICHQYGEADEIKGPFMGDEEAPVKVVPLAALQAERERADKTMLNFHVVTAEKQAAEKEAEELERELEANLRQCREHDASVAETVDRYREALERVREYAEQDPPKHALIELVDAALTEGTT